MKKLIEKLEKLKGQGYGVNGISRDAAISDCIEIVKAHDPWHDVSELPPREEEPEFSRELSISVLVRDEDGYYVDVDWYDFDLGKWENSKITPTHWAYLPEVNNGK